MTLRISLIASSVLLASCGLTSVPLISPYKMDIRQGNYITDEMRQNLELGMSKQETQTLLGTPMINDAFHGDRWDYIYRLEQQGEVTEQQHLALYFENDTLIKMTDGAENNAPEPIQVMVADASASNDSFNYNNNEQNLNVEPSIADNNSSSSAPDLYAPIVVANPAPNSYNSSPEFDPMAPVSSEESGTELYANSGTATSGNQGSTIGTITTTQEVEVKSSASYNPNNSYQPEAIQPASEQYGLSSNTVTPIETAPIYAPEAPSYNNTQSGNVTEDAIKTVQAWGKAWADKDVNGYIATYADNYAPAGKTHEQWKKQRSDIISKANQIDLELHEFEVKAINQNHVIAGFKQKYRADKFQDTTFKTLELMNTTGNWVIVAEESYKKAPAQLIAKATLPVAAPAPTSYTQPQAIAANTTSNNNNAPAIDDVDAISQVVFNWRDAWSSNNVNNYLASYSSKFKPEGMSYSSWKAQRKTRVGNAKGVQINVKDLNIDVQSATTAVASFTQDYRANSYQDTVSKTLRLAKQNGQWLIVSEESGKATKTAVSAANAIASTPSYQATSAPEPIQAPIPENFNSGSDDQAALLQRLQAWGTAWSAGDTEAYLASYANNFKPTGMSRSVWEKQRRQRVSSAQKIVLEVSNVHVIQHNEQSASIKFRQGYRSSSYRDNVEKTLKLEKTGSNWFIVSETQK